ncbi:MAG: hypothetical protein WBO09_21000, partial [Methylocystis silviterrae]|uniref:hypothetical protein n=1 Tax=Methylocystis silviterrae TaxID=2743612 RepID=UPI003C7139A3
RRQHRTSPLERRNRSRRHTLIPRPVKSIEQPWGPMMDAVLPILESKWFFMAAGFFIGFAAYAWADFLLRREPESSTALHAEQTRNSYSKETIRIDSLIDDTYPFISEKIFDRCIINGPAFLKVHDNNRFEFCSFSEDPKLHFLSLQEGQPIIGAVLLSGIQFKKCHFTNITFVGTETDTKSILPGFDQISMAEWRKKNLIGALK